MSAPAKFEGGGLNPESELENRLRAACDPCAECGHIDWRELDDCLPALSSEDATRPTPTHDRHASTDEYARALVKGEQP